MTVIHNLYIKDVFHKKNSDICILVVNNQFLKSYLSFFRVKKENLFSTNCTMLHGFRRIFQFFDRMFCNNRQSLHQHLKLLWCNLHSLFLCTWPTKATDVQSFIKKQKSITFPNKPFNSIGSFSAKQEQDMFLKRIQFNRSTGTGHSNGHPVYPF